MWKKQRSAVCFLLALLLAAGGLAACRQKQEPGENGQTAETIVTGTDEDGMKYTTVSLTDSGLARAFYAVFWRGYY